MPDVFGVTSNAHVVEQAALATLQAWLPAHVAHQERIAELPQGTLPFPTEFPTTSELDIQAHQRLPAVLLVSPGTIGTPEPLTNGTYRAQYRLETAIVVAGRTEREVRHHAALYLAAIRGVLLQQRTLGSKVEKVTWTGPDDHAIASLPVGREQRAIYATAFAVTVRDLVDQTAGLDEPPADPYEPGPGFISPDVAIVGIDVVAHTTDP